VNLPVEFSKSFAFAARAMIMNRRNVFAVFEMFFWPLIGLFSVGFLTRFLQLDSGAVSFVLTGALAMNTIQIAQLDISYSLLYDVWSKCLKHEFIAPIRLGHVILGAGVVGLARGLIVFAVMTVLAVYIFAMDLTTPGLVPLAIFFFGLFLMAAIEGALVLSLVLTFGHRAEVTAWAISYLVLLLSGMYYPVSLLPPGVETLARAIPLTHFLEYFRSFYGFPAPGGHPLLLGLLLSAVYLTVGYALLAFCLRLSRRRGILLKLSE